MPIETISEIVDLRTRLNEARANNSAVGFVPTMGFLHDGHASLMRQAREDVGPEGTVVASIFVNPLQFGADEDLETYPRDIYHDMSIAEAAGVDVLFTPPASEMYPFGPVLTSVHVDALATRWEGATRPEHFAGVATVVTKLFAIVGPCRAFFGEKDFQQLTIVKRFTADLSFPVTVVGCPIVRAPDGLALSSRNSYLNETQRQAATVVPRALTLAAEAIADGERDPDQVTKVMVDEVAAEPLAALDYAAVVDQTTLEVPNLIVDGCRLIIAAKIGEIRLLDNLGVHT